jgi:hypothetical protein
MATTADLIIKVRDGLFMASSRTYAEQYIEPLIREKYDLLLPRGDDHDALGRDGVKYEIKASKVLHPTGNGKSVKTLMDRILFESDHDVTKRLVPFTEHKTAGYLANIQNVKRDHFEILIYVLLFEDCIKVFFVNSTDIAKGALPSWSDKHGRYDEPGKSGQFPVTKSTITWHLKKNLVDTIVYSEAAMIFERLSI